MRYGVNGKFIYLLVAATNFEMLVLLVPSGRLVIFRVFPFLKHLSNLHTYDDAPNSKAPRSPHPPIHTTLYRVYIDQLNRLRPSSQATKQPE